MLGLSLIYTFGKKSFQENRFIWPERPARTGFRMLQK